MQYQIEALKFLKHRYEEDVKLANELVASNEFNDAFDVVTTFLQNAATEYATERASHLHRLEARCGNRQTCSQAGAEAAEDISVAATA